MEIPARKYPFRRNETSLLDLEKETLFIILLFHHVIYFYMCLPHSQNFLDPSTLPHHTFHFPSLQNPTDGKIDSKSSIQGTSVHRDRSLISDDYIPMEPVILDLYRLESPSFEPK